MHTSTRDVQYSMLANPEYASQQDECQVNIDLKDSCIGEEPN